MNVSPPPTPHPPEEEEILNQNNKAPSAESRVVINSLSRTEASRTPAIAEPMSTPLRAMLLGHTPNTGSISAKEKRDSFRKFLSNSKLKVFK